MSPSPDDLPPDFGTLGQTPEEHERQRIRELEALKAAESLNEAQADRPMRTNFGGNEQESWDDPASTHETIARMAAGRASALIRASKSLPPAPGSVVFTDGPPHRSVPQVFEDNARSETQLMVQAVVGELSRELRGTLANLKEDIDANTRLLGVMNAPMEAITDSHERAASSFETLRHEIANISGTGSSHAIEALTKVVDTAGLGEAQSRAERRFEELAISIERRLVSVIEVQNKSFAGLALDMTKILHLLERLQARELRETKRRMEAGAKRAVGKVRK